MQTAETARNIPVTDGSRPFGIGAISPELWLDIQCCALLLGLAAVMVLPRGLTLPMELYDESRVANNAMEMARHGSWMVPTFGYVPDHWNTKPPLLIWIIASLLRTGMNPMLAIRLPSFAATMGSVLLVYLTCRVTLRDRLAGVLAGLLLTSSLLLMGDHVGRTGDYDALLTFLCLGFVVSAGRYIDAPTDRSGKWIGLTAVLLFLGVMTKGVTAGMLVPGILAYAIIRRRFFAIARDWRLWAAILCVTGGMALWLLPRERLDPGYFAAMWYSDVGGRFMTAQEAHGGAWWYYPRILVMAFEPGILLLPMLLFMRRDSDPVRRRLCLLMVLTAGSMFLAITYADSKCYWYVAPVVPLLAVAVGTATTTFLRRAEPPLRGGVVIRPIIVALLITCWLLNFNAPDANRAYASSQVWYGPFLEKVRGEIPLDGAVIIDQGLHNDAGFQNYNPVARFFAEDAARHGEHIQVAAAGAPVAPDATIVSCDPRVQDWLKAQASFNVIRHDDRCFVGRYSIRTGEPQTNAAE